jgi:hypothetical protein
MGDGKEKVATADEELQVDPITWWSFLKSMAVGAWECFRHPFTTSVIDLSTGRVLRRE